MKIITCLRGGALALVCAIVFASASSQADGLDHALGKALFDRIWTSAPAVTKATDGLGPLFNARSCAACHPGNGRGTFGEDENRRITGTGLLLRVGDETGTPDPVYGEQLQTLAVQGLKAEGYVVRTEGGSLKAEGLNYGKPAPTTRMSGRLAPDLRGLGLLQQIPDQVILAMADEDDANQDGISGRANYSYNAEGETVLSRFGWKAGKSTIAMQSAAALNNDIGLSNPIYGKHEGDCTEHQPLCLSAPHGGDPSFEYLEIDTQMLDLIVSFVTNLKPPKPHKDAQGLALFTDTGCAACHVPSYTLENGRKIAPFTNLLLHDMGDALADGIGDAEATGREWRTPPLWGLKRAERFLHDGRATTLREAIEFHGGEAQRARAAFRTLAAEDQDKLIRFLSNL